jgi:tRNA(Ile)-lysidine synthase
MEEGNREFRFVEGLAEQSGLPFEGERVEPGSYEKGANVQAQARRLRSRFFEDVARKWGAARVATGHHRDDHAETLLMQALRGTGGLIGIRPVREGRYIRPLIEIARDRIREYASASGLLFCEDSSNRARTYLRNRIRQDLVPWIRREANPSFVDSLLRLASILEEERKCIEGLAAEAFEDAVTCVCPGVEVILRRHVLERMPTALQRHVLRLSYRKLEGSTRGLSYSHTQGICDALANPAARAHKVYDLPRGVRAFLEYGTLCMTHRDLWEAPWYEIPVPRGERWSLPVPAAGILLRAQRVEYQPSSPKDPEDRNRACLDADLAMGRGVVRNVRPGDRFRPLGLGGEKKLKDFFIDEKIPRSLRRRIAILEVDGRVAWVVGYRIDDRFKISGQTGRVLKIEAIEQCPA